MTLDPNFMPQINTDETQMKPLLAWAVEINSMTCIVFATTKPKANYVAVKGYREAYGQRRGEWPRARSWREPIYDNSSLRFRNPQPWAEAFVMSAPNSITGGAS